MTENSVKKAPEIKKVQYNVPGTEHIFEVDQEYCGNINHDDWGARIVLENDNFIELRKINEETMEECVFKQEEKPTGSYEATLYETTEIDHVNLSDLGKFWEAVDTNIEVYQSSISNIEDAEISWSSIVPALK